MYQESGSFQLFVYEDEATEYQIYNATETLTVTMLEAYPFSELKVTPISTVNNAITDYKIKVEGTMSSQSEDLLEIKFPSQIRLGANVECTGETYQLSP